MMPPFCPCLFSSYLFGGFLSTFLYLLTFQLLFLAKFNKLDRLIFFLRNKT